jgi:hypothetical protein
MDYSEYKISRVGKRSQDTYTLSYEPKDSPCGVQMPLSTWVAHLVVAILKEKCPENVSENEYGYMREQNKPTRESND